jgi:hypothetical protein
LKLRFIAGVVAFFLLVAAVLGAVLFGPDLLSGASNGSRDTAQPVTGVETAIARENAQLGTQSWMIPQGKEASIQIQAYAGATSVLPGQKLSFSVSTRHEGMLYSVGIYRLGWYGGDGGRLMDSQRDLVGHAQGYYDPASYRLVGCKSCTVDTKVGLVEANWQPSYILSVPSDWTTGVYLAKFTDAEAMQTYAPFDVKGNSLSRYVAVTPDTTSQAYNTWGGYSLYEADRSAASSALEVSSAKRAVKVSFDRPYLQAAGSGDLLLYEANAIRWLERQGYDLSYISNIDVHENAAQLLDHKAYLSLGHDEYWTKEMRDGVEQARDRGVGLAFLGADAAYWQMRLEPDRAGTPNRTVVCYKVETANKDLARDPLYGTDNSRVTSLWRDRVVGRPENALIGIMYSGLTHARQGFPWKASFPAASPLLAGTGLQAGQQYGCDLVGYEWDRVYTNGATPAGLQVLGTSQTQASNHTSDVSDTTYYIAPSGAMVFATGSIYWTRGLDTYLYQADALCAGQSAPIAGMQRLMARIMDALARTGS